MNSPLEPLTSLPKTGRIMGLDFGTKRTGIALSDETQSIASPHKVLETSDRRLLFENLVQLIREYEVVGIVVGIPLNQYGERGVDAEKMEKLVAVLQQKTALPVVEWDERFSTVQAERLLITADVSRNKRKTVIDKVAAAILLQNYLDSLVSDTISVQSEHHPYF